MEDPHTRDEWHDIIATLIARNGSGGSVRVLAGHARRRARPQSRAAAEPSAHGVCLLRRPFRHAARRSLENGVACVTAQDTRWARCDIKSVSLLANVLLRQLAVDANAERDHSAARRRADGSVLVRRARGDRRRDRARRRTRGKILPGTTRGVIEEDRRASRHPVHRSTRVTEASCAAPTRSGSRAAMREMSCRDHARRQAASATVKSGPLYKRSARRRSSATRRELAGDAVVRDATHQATSCCSFRPTIPSRSSVGRRPSSAHGFMPSCCGTRPTSRPIASPSASAKTAISSPSPT